MKRWQIQLIVGAIALALAAGALALFGQRRGLVLVFWIIEILTLGVLNRRDRAARTRDLDELWRLAAKQRLNVEAVAAMFPHCGRLDLEASRRPQPQFYPPAKQVKRAIAKLAALPKPGQSALSGSSPKLRRSHHDAV